MVEPRPGYEQNIQENYACKENRKRFQGETAKDDTGDLCGRVCPCIALFFRGILYLFMGGDWWKDNGDFECFRKYSICADSEI